MSMLFPRGVSDWLGLDSYAISLKSIFRLSHNARCIVKVGTKSGEDTKRNLKHVKDRTAQLVSSVTRITPTLRACANARTFLRSARLLRRPGIQDDLRASLTSHIGPDPLHEDAHS